MKKNGFTFIEVLGVIALLSLLSVIILVTVDKSLKESKETLTQVQIESIKSAASMWRTDNIEFIPEQGYYIITLGELIDLGYFKNEDIFDSNGNSEYDRNIVIGINMKEIVFDVSELDDIISDNISKEIQLIGSKVNNSVVDGVYYYDLSGNLEKNSSLISLSRNWNRPRGNILVHNHQFISGCIQLNGKNYDYYKGVLTELDYPCSTVRGENLIVNGDLSYGDNTNFSNYTYNEVNGEKYFSYYTNVNAGPVHGPFIPVDINKQYNMGITIKTDNTSATVYYGFKEYDIDRNPIVGGNTKNYNNSLTTLARDLNDGDQYIYLTDMTNWFVNSNSYRGIIVWNYKDSTGFEYPPSTYSPNLYSNLYDDVTTDVIKQYDLDGEIVGRIELTKAWSKGFIPEGTYLGQIFASGAVKYPLKDGGHYQSEWTDYRATISGTGTSRFNFNAATRYIQLFEFPNYNKSGGADGVTTYYKDIYMREVVE